MNIKQSISRIFTIILLVLAWVGTANAAADSWEYGLHNKDFKFSGGSGTHSDPYIIGNAQDLADLAYLVTEKNDDVTGKYFKQTADITLNDFEVSDNINEENINAKEWTPIGEYGFWRDDDFQGFYDGGGHYISGLYFGEKAAERYYIGLFGSCEDAIISNLTLKNVYIDNLNSSVYSYIGALVGYSMGSTFNNVRVESCKILISPNKKQVDCGGFIGHAGHSQYFTDDFFNGNIIIKDNINNNFTCGGFVGNNGYKSVFTHCKTGKGRIFIHDTKSEDTGSWHTLFFVGGFVGENTQHETQIFGCVNQMDILVYKENEKYTFNSLWAFNFARNCSKISQSANFGNIITQGNVNGTIGFNELMVYNNEYDRYKEEIVDCVNYGVYLTSTKTVENGEGLNILPFNYKRDYYGSATNSGKLPTGSNDDANIVLRSICPREANATKYGNYASDGTELKLADIKAQADDIIQKNNDANGKRV